jgi:chaperonin GroES
MIEKMRPLRDRVLVKRLELEAKTPGGLYIPDAAKEKPQQGVVVATGPGRVTTDGKTLPMSVKKGDTIFFGKYAGTEANAEYLIIGEDEILGIVEEAR